MRAESFRKWYVVHTKSRQEALALMHLERQGFETYLPLMSERRRVAGRAQTQIVPMFPRYLFVRINLTNDNAAPIRSTIGCVGLVKFGFEPAQLDDEIVDALHEREGVDGLISSELPAWPPGSSLRIVDGPFCGMNAAFFARSGDERVLVLMEILGQHRQVELPERAVIKLD